LAGDLTTRGDGLEGGTSVTGGDTSGVSFRFAGSSDLTGGAVTDAGDLGGASPVLLSSSCSPFSFSVFTGDSLEGGLATDLGDWTGDLVGAPCRFPLTCVPSFLGGVWVGFCCPFFLGLYFCFL